MAAVVVDTQPKVATRRRASYFGFPCRSDRRTTAKHRMRNLDAVRKLRHNDETTVFKDCPFNCAGANCGIKSRAAGANNSHTQFFSGGKLASKRIGHCVRECLAWACVVYEDGSFPG
jgi:hypothetical protein